MVNCRPGVQIRILNGSHAVVDGYWVSSLGNINLSGHKCKSEAQEKTSLGTSVFGLRLDFKTRNDGLDLIINILYIYFYFFLGGGWSRLLL